MDYVLKICLTILSSIVNIIQVTYMISYKDREYPV